MSKEILIQIVALILGVLIIINFLKIYELFYKIKYLYKIKVAKIKFYIRIKRLQDEVLEHAKNFEVTMMENWVKKSEEGGIKLPFKYEYLIMEKLIEQFYKTEKKRLYELDIFEKDKTKIEKLKPQISEKLFRKYYNKSKAKLFKVGENFKDYEPPKDVFERKL